MQFLVAREQKVEFIFIFVFAEIALLENEVNRSFHAANLSLTFHLVFCTVLQIQYGKSTLLQFVWTSDS